MPSDLILFLAIVLVIAVGIAVAVRRAGRAQLPSPRPPAKLPRPEERRLPPAKPGREARAPEAEAPPAGAVTAAPIAIEQPREKPTLAPPPAIVQAEAKPLRLGLEKTRSGLVSRLAAVFGGKKQIDAATLERLEEVLLTADIGVRTSQKLFDSLKRDLSKAELTDVEAVWDHIRRLSIDILDVGAPGLDLDAAHPFVLLTIGVNGVGKTTTIGKLAAKYRAAGKRVLLAAGDTFRAAATEQLEIWGQRTEAPVVKGKEGGDPSSVIFEAIKKASAEGYDVIIADTAGRLHTKTELMEELQKVRRVADKALPGAPHEVLLVVDATTGQNAIAQAQIFKEAMAITGIALTKLDGTAKGGVILGICDELKVPVRYIGLGEKVTDLRDFDPMEFVAALYDRADESQPS